MLSFDPHHRRHQPNPRKLKTKQKNIEEFYQFARIQMERRKVFRAFSFANGANFLRTICKTQRKLIQHARECHAYARALSNKQK